MVGWHVRQKLTFSVSGSCGYRTRHWVRVSKIRFCVSKKQNFCLSDSEFNFAETKIANFWQREHPVGDFSLVRFFWSSKEMNENGRTRCVPTFLHKMHNSGE